MKAMIRNSRLLALLLGLTSTSLFTIVGTAASQSTVLTADRNLSQYWRTTYDILVRPQGARSPIENEYGLVAANHLSGIDGGVSFRQYELIKSIPGVETAAPIAMLGYILWSGETKGFELPTQQGAYLLETTFQTGDGTPAKDEERSYYFISPGEEIAGITEEDFPFIILYVNPPESFAATSFQTGLLVAGIDPSQEARLIGLENAMIEGEYLKENKPLIHSRTRPCVPGNYCPKMEVAVPMLISNSVYVDEIMRSTLKRLDLDPEIASLEDLLSRGGIKYLAASPSEVIDTQVTDSEWAHQNMIKRLKDSPYGTNASLHGLPTPLEYRESYNAFMEDKLALEIVMPDIQSDESCPTCSIPMYRLLVRGKDVETMRDSLRLNAFFEGNYVGTFNIEHMPKPLDVNRVPLETYFPPVVILRYDEQGNPVDPHKELHPTSNAAGYIQSPPLILTTLETVRALRGDDAISAIRVRVALENCPADYLTCPLTPQNQRKIETIAGEITHLTGLDVDIIVGSSPTQVLVHVPGVGYVEEQWIQKNVTYTYKERVQSGHLLLLGTLLGIGGLFALDLAWAEVVARRRTIALQKALGWRSATVFRQILGQIVLVSVVATVLGSLAAWGASLLLGWERPSPALLIGVPLLVVGLAAIGGLYPAWLAACLPPVVGLRRVGARHQRVRPDRFRKPVRSRPGGLAAYAWQGLGRRWSRTALGALTATLSAALLVLMLAVTVDRQGAMSGTLLGEFILVRIEGYHYVIVGIGFGLAALSLANSLLAGVLERQREIGVLKAVGWRTNAVARLFMAEGMLLGGLGGLTGAVLGLAVFVGLYEIVSPSLAWIGLVGVGVPVGVGLLAALYPARVAARVPPAEAVRYE